jgi:hypothetical protein
VRGGDIPRVSSLSRVSPARSGSSLEAWREHLEANLETPLKGADRPDRLTRGGRARSSLEGGQPSLIIINQAHPFAIPLWRRSYRKVAPRRSVFAHPYGLVGRTNPALDVESMDSTSLRCTGCPTQPQTVHDDACQRPPVCATSVRANKRCIATSV